MCRDYSVLNEENRINILVLSKKHPDSAINTIYQEAGISCRLKRQYWKCY